MNVKEFLRPSGWKIIVTLAVFFSSLYVTGFASFGGAVIIWIAYLLRWPFMTAYLFGQGYGAMLIGNLLIIVYQYILVCVVFYSVRKFRRSKS